MVTVQLMEREGEWVTDLLKNGATFLFHCGTISGGENKIEQTLANKREHFIFALIWQKPEDRNEQPA